MKQADIEIFENTSENIVLRYGLERDETIEIQMIEISRDDLDAIMDGLKRME